MARRLTEACPVDIFAQKPDGSLEIVEQNLDECVLCRLCLDAVAGECGEDRQALRRLRRPRLRFSAAPSGKLAIEPMNENFSLIVMCLFLLASLVFLAQQISAYH